MDSKPTEHIERLIDRALQQVSQSRRQGDDAAQGLAWIKLSGACLLAAANDEAISALQHAISCFARANRPDDESTARLRLAHLLRLLNRPDEARDISAALPSKPHLHSARLQQLFAEERFAQAVEQKETDPNAYLQVLTDAYEAALTNADIDAASRHILTRAEFLDQLNRPTDAQALLLSAITDPRFQVNPSAVLTLRGVHLVRFILKGGAKPDATAALEVIVEGARNQRIPDAEIRALLGAASAWIARGDIDEARTLAERALSLSLYVVDPFGYLQSSGHLALIHWHTSQNPEMFGVLLRAETTLNDLHPTLGTQWLAPVYDQFKDLVGADVFEQAREDFYKKYNVTSQS